jgi:hypothetical protein
MNVTRFARILPALLMAGCAYQGSTDPVSRKFSWYDYLGGGDIKRSCVPGAPDRYRFVYNAIYIEQVRTYDLQTDAGRPGENLLTARVIGPAQLGSVPVGEAADVLGPWKGKIAQTWLRDADVTTLSATAREAGLFSPPPVGLRLHSDRFYWTVAACEKGVFAFNGYLWPSERFERLQFPKLLFAWDQTGVRVNPPRQATAFDIHGRVTPERGESRLEFEVEVGDNGLKGTGPLF